MLFHPNLLVAQKRLYCLPFGFIEWSAEQVLITPDFQAADQSRNRLVLLTRHGLFLPSDARLVVCERRKIGEMTEPPDAFFIYKRRAFNHFCGAPCRLENTYEAIIRCRCGDVLSKFASACTFLISSSAINFRIWCLMADVEGSFSFRPNRNVRIAHLSGHLMSRG